MEEPISVAGEPAQALSAGAADAAVVRSIPVRRPVLDFDDVPRHYLEGNSAKTHFFNALNLLFPDGERFFVKSVRDHAHLIHDPALRDDIDGFCGQEGQHANQHQRFFKVLERQGYPIERLLQRFRAFARSSNRFVPKALRLSVTAGAEHYTASMARLVLERDMVARAHPAMRQLILWHAIEELEHKHVAFDVQRKLRPYNYPLRVLGFGLATLVIAIWTYAGLRLLFGHDGRSGQLSRAAFEQDRAALQGPKEVGFRRALRRLLLQYLRPGFHPNQTDERELIARFLPEVRYSS